MPRQEATQGNAHRKQFKNPKESHQKAKHRRWPEALAVVAKQRCRRGRPAAGSSWPAARGSPWRSLAGSNGLPIEGRHRCRQSAGGGPPQVPHQRKMTVGCGQQLEVGCSNGGCRGRPSSGLAAAGQLLGSGRPCGLPGSPISPMFLFSDGLGGLR